MSGRTVWLASYPKSGNTWFRAVYAAWKHGDALALDADEPIAALRAPIDHALGLASSDLTAAELARLRPRADEVIDATHDGPHLRKIHDALMDEHGQQVVSTDATSCAIYLVRDPRDVAVSYAHHSDRAHADAVRHLSSAGAAINDGPELRPQVRQHLGSWTDHAASWVDHAPFPVFVLRYEDLLADPVPAFGAALRFGGFSITRGELATAVSEASFTALQARERLSGFAERWSRTSPFFRRGAAGGWQDELSSELARTVEHDHAATMRRFGYLESDPPSDR